MKDGFKEIGDLFNGEGNLLSMEEFQNKAGRRIPFVTHQGIIQAIPGAWRATITEGFIYSQNPQLSKLQGIILQDEKGCIAIRDTLQKNIMAPGWEAKWNTLTNEIIEPGD